MPAGHGWEGPGQGSKVPAEVRSQVGGARSWVKGQVRSSDVPEGGDGGRRD